jgi:hypothetical protein
MPVPGLRPALTNPRATRLVGSIGGLFEPKSQQGMR